MYHTVIIVGNLGRDPEMRFTPSGQAVTNLNVATNRQYTSSNGEQVKETIWFRVAVWGKQAENCNNFLKKGSKVLIEGRLTPDPATGGPRTYTRGDGSSGAQYEITANTVRFLSTRGEDEGLGQSGSYESGGGDDDIPF
jgi:single-strand DNA-binding protein